MRPIRTQQISFERLVSPKLSSDEIKAATVCCLINDPWTSPSRLRKLLTPQEHLVFQHLLLTQPTKNVRKEGVLRGGAGGVGG